ncbi:ras GTPase-activating protein-binding protein 1-like [Trifolium medium]|uniref:Ras GTPase-activating protein-binding protein 1-like n=1 Tax=Trifolium medium TaxID=97028 RepID=A0A392NJ69_9FABA|nr:ras GTPase-activating protein-binding protein 1-like [Trifolium medium]
MAMQEANPTSAPSPQVVGNAFVEQYYHILHQSPDLVHRFYQDSSLLSRSDSNGVMKTVTTTKIVVWGHSPIVDLADPTLDPAKAGALQNQVSLLGYVKRPVIWLE